jgi:hypothetical protein
VRSAVVVAVAVPIAAVVTISRLVPVATVRVVPHLAAVASTVATLVAHFGELSSLVEVVRGSVKP